MAYDSVNSAWPADTNDGRNLKPTPQEALAAAKRLYRFAFKRPFRGQMKLTSGRRYTQIRSGVFYVNPDWRGGGWHELVHLFSHYASSRLYPHARGHGSLHSTLERDLIEHVVRSGWLEGKLRRPERRKPQVDVCELRHRRVLARIARWQSKMKRAQTMLRKLARQRAYYERRQT